MGRTPKPLTILCSDEVAGWEEIIKLREQGHTILTWFDVAHSGFKPDDIDLIVDGRCWRMNKDLRPYVELAIKEGRKVRYPKEKDE